MRKNGGWRGVRRTLGALALLGGAMLAAPSGAQAVAVEQCPAGQALVRLDEKVCPANAERPTIIVRRACCEKSDNRGNPKVHCKHFPHCPKKSPSE